MENYASNTKNIVWYFLYKMEVSKDVINLLETTENTECYKMGNLQDKAYSN